MIRTAKAPLIMKNGAKATDMKSLLCNFNINSVLGYFLSGKLEKWLVERYYEDEANVVANLRKDAPYLLEDLCAVFGVEYEVDSLDFEAVTRRCERLAYLEEFTDDEDALQNIDCVAFNQEELAELYDEGAEKIYLCEGEFNIPTSKQHIEYVLVGKVSVKGLRTDPVPAPKAYEGLWRDVLRALDGKLSKTAMTTWFGDCEYVDFKDRTLTLRSPSEFRRKVIFHVYSEHLQDALRKIYGRGEFEIVVLLEE